jgi:branched-chain amino acid transport system permease protein
MKMIWGKDIRSIPAPSALSGTIEIAGIAFPSYRLLLIAVGVILFVGNLVCHQANSCRRADPRLGCRPRHGQWTWLQHPVVVHDDLCLRHAVAGLAGVLGAPITGIYPGLDFEVLITTLIVVVVGGLGSISGALGAGLLIGLAETYGKALYPAMASFTVFGLMAVVLLLRAWGRDEEEVQ